jgi:hypothetical protein
MSLFSGCPDQIWPHESTNDARVMLLKAHETASAFLQAYRDSRRGKTGASTDAEQDLLRAMLAFATAGLDATLKQITRECLPILLDAKPAAGEDAKVESGLRTFLARRSATADGPDYKLLAEIITSRDPRAEAANMWIEDLTSHSLQSRAAALTVCNSLGLDGGGIFPVTLKEVFDARNQIVHEMDLNPGEANNRSRRQRREGPMIELTQRAFTAAERFLRAVEDRLASR